MPGAQAEWTVDRGASDLVSSASRNEATSFASYTSLRNEEEKWTGEWHRLPRRAHTASRYLSQAAEVLASVLRLPSSGLFETSSRHYQRVSSPSLWDGLGERQIALCPTWDHVSVLRERGSKLIGLVGET